MLINKKFQCEYCPSLLSSKSNLANHQKRNQKCLKLRGKEIKIAHQEICDACGFTSISLGWLKNHNCRPEHKEQLNKIKFLSNTVDKLNNDIKGIKLDHKDMISNMKEDLGKKYKTLEQKFNTLELENERHISDFVNLERSNDIIINELKAKIEKYENKIFDIASKPSSVVHNANTTNNNIQMLIQKLVPVSEHEMIKLFETVCTKETILNGVDTLMEELGSAMKNNYMLCTDTNRNKLTYKNEDNEVITDTNGKVILPHICKWGQVSIDKGYIEAEKIIKERTSNEDDYESQMKYLDKEWQYKYPRIKSGIGEKESRKAAKILAERVKVHE